MMQSTSTPAGVGRRWRIPPTWAIGLATAVLLGALLRLVWVADIEYKGDEAWTFVQTQRVGRTEPLPWLGMWSSVNVPNPGMSLWVFLLLGKLAAVQDPTTLARAVQISNIVAIVLLIVFALRAIPGPECEAWLWAAALVAVNPLAVLFHRKIWPPCVLPIFIVFMLVGWWHRERRWGAFAWGLVGICLGQIHMAAFFFAAGFAAWAALFDRRSVAWTSWLCGTGLGALPLIPWLWTQFGHWSSTTFKWMRWFEFKFWIRWATEPLGLGLEYSLGPHFSDFLRYPLIDGRPSYGVLLLHIVLIVVGVVILFRAAQQLRRDRSKWRDLWIGRQSSTAFTQSAVLWGYGILLTASGVTIHRHYMIVIFPFEYLWLARLTLGYRGQYGGGLRHARALLLVLCVAQLLLSASFLGYIHVNRGAIHGDYGVAYGAQKSIVHPPSGN